MKRTKGVLSTYTQIISEILSRSGLARRLGYQYGDKRNVYKALGYPDEKDLDFEYFYNKYDRQDIANAIINRPVEATWKGTLTILEVGKNEKESVLNEKWKELDKAFGIKKRLNKVDKLCELGRYSLLVLGLDDVKSSEDFKKPVAGGNRKLLYVKQVAESEGQIEKWDNNPQSPRYGMPTLYKIKSGTVQTTGPSTSVVQEFQDIVIHHTRVLHLVTSNLTSEIFGVSKLKPVVNRLVDLEKLLGGDAEMFWRGARPGYTATAKEDYELGDDEEGALMETLDKYEHDLRRFIVTKGIDINALESQISDPLNHIDAQLQAISSQTGIPKRILIGSERGELSSSQDADQWKDLIQTRQLEHAEPTVLRPLIDTLMKYGILPKIDKYNVYWPDIYAPSIKDKADIGKSRADALRSYAESALASEILPPQLAFKHLLGLNEEETQEAIKLIDEQRIEELKFRMEESNTGGRPAEGQGGSTNP